MNLILPTPKSYQLYKQELTGLQSNTVLARQAEHCMYRISCLLQAESQESNLAAHNVSDEFVRIVSVASTPRTMTTHEIEEVYVKNSLSCYNLFKVWNLRRPGLS